MERLKTAFGPVFRWYGWLVAYGSYKHIQSMSSAWDDIHLALNREPRVSWTKRMVPKWCRSDLLNMGLVQESFGGCLQESSHGCMMAVVSAQWGNGSEEFGELGLSWRRLQLKRCLSQGLRALTIPFREGPFQPCCNRILRCGFL
jgi:hypothetical protein